MHMFAPTLSDCCTHILRLIACAGIASHPNSSTRERPTEGVECVCGFLEAWLTIRSFFVSECWCKIVRFAHVISHVTRHVAMTSPDVTWVLIFNFLLETPQWSGS